MAPSIFIPDRTGGLRHQSMGVFVTQTEWAQLRLRDRAEYDSSMAVAVLAFSLVLKPFLR